MPTSILYEPSACTVAMRFWVLPALSVTAIDTVLPAGKSVVPDIVGVVSLSAPNASIVSDGAAELMVPLTLSLAVLPASSVAFAVTV